MTPYDFLPHRIDILFPHIRIGSVVAKRQVNVKRAIEYLQTGLYAQHFSESGAFLGIIYSPNTAKPLRARYIPEEFSSCPIELPGLKFLQPANATPTYLRTVTQSI